MDVARVKRMIFLWEFQDGTWDVSLTDEASFTDEHSRVTREQALALATKAMNAKKGNDE